MMIELHTNNYINWIEAAGEESADLNQVWALRTAEILFSKKQRAERTNETILHFVPAIVQLSV